jgi:hypothetical protein
VRFSISNSSEDELERLAVETGAGFGGGGGGDVDQFAHLEAARGKQDTVSKCDRREGVEG